MNITFLRNCAFAAIAAGSLSAFAVEPDAEILKMASNYYAYPYTDAPAPELTAAPSGYVPFHIEHYGRHGSRWHIGKNMYNKPIQIMEIAERNGKLTPRGVELLKQLREIEVASRGRDGELTPLGARQHRGIAQRMARNFPQVFADTARVDARSTVVIRCILSMDNELQELAKYNPALRIISDASYADMHYMNFTDTDTVAMIAANKADEKLKEFNKQHPASNEFINVIINDPKFAADSINANSLRWYLMKIAFNAQSHDDMVAPFDIFTRDEVRNEWLRDNASWFAQMGNSALTDNLAAYSQRRLLKNFIESADTAIVSLAPGANLRFGHEVCVLPLVVLMELDNFGEEINDFNELEGRWHNYDIFPMASNVQLIFYRPLDGKRDLLVKVLLNEHEARLPFASQATAPYYKWSDVRDYYLKKLERVPLY